ncbi:RNA methyltransferase family protein [Wolffia australiana]
MGLCRIPPLNSFLRQPPQRLLRASFSSTAATHIASPPLFLRPARHSASKEDLQAFHSWASSLTYSDPDQNHLLCELRWLLQDACASSLDTHELLSSSQQMGPVPLRVELNGLYGLWRERVEERRPLQYLVGCEHWRDMVLVVKEGVLIPRPETEAVVDMAAKAMKGKAGGPWADLGTGSGALALGIARVIGEGEEDRVYAVDLSPVAVEVAKFNVQRYGLEDKIEVRQGSWFEPLGDLKGRLAGIVSNPPYIPSSDLPGLQAEVSKHEPWLALDGGEDGLKHLLHLCEGSSAALRSGGFFVFETNGDEQSKFIANFLATNFHDVFSGVKISKDFAGIGRFISGFRR